MDPRDSGIFRLASVGSYLDALSTITDEMSLKERSNLIFLDRCLHELWGLGQNVILNWCAEGDGIALLVVPHYGDRRVFHATRTRRTRHPVRMLGPGNPSRTSSRRCCRAGAA